MRLEGATHEEVVYDQRFRSFEIVDPFGREVKETFEEPFRRI